MTTPLSSWNGQLPTDALLDSGIIYLGASIFSAQDGGLKFAPGKEMRQIPFDGQRSAIAGNDRTVFWKPMVTGTVLQIPSTAVIDLEPGASTVTLAGGPSGATQIQPKSAGVLYAAGDYISNLRAVWQRTDQTYVQVRFPKALCTKWDLAGTDKNEGKFAVEFEARLDMSVSGQLVTNCPFVMEYFAVQP